MRLAIELATGWSVARLETDIALWKCYIKNVVLFEENSILPLPGRSEASGVESVWDEVPKPIPESQTFPLNRNRLPKRHPKKKHPGLGKKATQRKDDQTMTKYVRYRCWNLPQNPCLGKRKGDSSIKRGKSINQS